MAQAISYIRFSSKIQERGDSLRRQQDYIDVWVKNNPDITPSGMDFKDLGLSAFKGNHLKHGLGRLLEAINEGYINDGDYLLVEHIDRIGRLEALEMLELIGAILKAGVTIVSLSDNQIYTKESLNGSQLFLLVVKIQSAFQYSDVLSKRTRDTWQGKRVNAKKGEFVRRASPWWITNHTDRYEITKENQHLIKSVFELYLLGHGSRAISKKLDYKVKPHVIDRALQNKVAIGEWDGIKNVFPKAIEESLFYRVHSAIEKRKVKHSSSSKTKMFLSGLVVCGNCGGNFRVKGSAKNSNRRTMVCNTSQHRPYECDNTTTIPYPILLVMCFLSHKEAMNRILTNHYENKQQIEIDAINGKLSDLNIKIDKTYKLILKNEDSEYLELQYNELENEKKELKVALVDIENQLTESSNTNEYSTSDFSTEQDIDKDLEVKNLLLKKVGFKMVANGTNVVSEGLSMNYLGKKKKKLVIGWRDRKWGIPQFDKPFESEKSEVEMYKFASFDLITHFDMVTHEDYNKPLENT